MGRSWVIGMILCVSDDNATVHAVKTACGRIGVDLVVVDDVGGMRPPSEETDIDVVVCDYDRSDELQRARPGLHRLVVVDPRQSDQMIKAMRHGAFDCLVSPLQTDDVEARLKRAIEVARTNIAVPNADVPPAMSPRDRMVGQSPAMQEVYKRIGLVAPQNVNVLITGESGTGKELVARAIHEHSAREQEPLLAINCAAIPESLLESELFGHEKGAFTGAERRRVGRFEACDGGTLFLDEIGDMPLATQAKLLRVLQDRSFQRVGGNETIRSDVRIIAATHQSLDDLVAKRQFRADLYFRLKVAVIHMPPLRDREVDVVLLAHHIVNCVRDEFRTSVLSFSPEAVRALLMYSWPGNVRELENVIKSALTVAKGQVLRVEHLPDPVGTAFRPAGPTDTSTAPHLEDFVRCAIRTGEPGKIHSSVVAELEAALIAAALEQTHSNGSAAAELLGISRTTLRKKISDLGLSP